jgi:hypothetical protein
VQAERDGAAIQAATAGRPFALVGLPEVKKTDAVGFPLAAAGVTPLPPDALGPGGPSIAVTVCDPTFELVLDAACGGAAEDAWMRARGIEEPPPDQLPGTGPRRVTLVYALAP